MIFQGNVSSTVEDVKELPGTEVRTESTLPAPIEFGKRDAPMACPFDVPLVNIAHSIAYAFSPSNIDPFANLLKLLHQKRSNDNDFFFQLTQTLASNAPPTALLPTLFSLMYQDLSNEHPFWQKPVIESLTVLSVNNPEFSQGVLSNLPLLLDISQFGEDQFLADVLSLFEVVCEYADMEQATAIVANFRERNLIRYPHKSKQEPYSIIRARVHSVFAKLAVHGNAFDCSIVDEIMIRCNYPGKGELCKEIMWPAVVAVEMFLRQPNTEAYRKLESRKNELLGKLGLAVIGCEKKNDTELKVVVMKVFLEACDEFCIEDLENSLNDLQLCLVAAVISMYNFGEPPVKRLAKTIIDRFKIYM